MAGHQTFYKEVMFLDKFECVYCGKQTKDLAIDHYIAQSKGGPDVIDNLFACCLNCNSKKKDRPAYVAGMFPRFGRFRYITEWAEKVAMEAVELQKTQVVEARPVRKPGLVYQLWERGILPTKEPLGRFETWVFEAIVVCLVLLILAGLITGIASGWGNALGVWGAGLIFGGFAWAVGLAAYYENQEKSKNA